MLDAVVPVASGFKAHGIDGTVHFRLTQQVSDLFMQRGVFGQVGNFKALRLGVGQANRVHVPHDHHGGAQQTRGRRRRKPHRPGARNVDRAAGANARRDGAVVTGGQDVREASQVADFLHRGVAVREFEQVEIRIRDQYIFRLTAHPVAHVHVTISTPGTGRVDGQAHAGVLLFATAAPPTGHVERHRYQIPDLQMLHVTPGLDHLAGNFVPQYEPGLRRGTAAHHVLV